MRTVTYAIQSAKRRWSHRKQFDSVKDWTVILYDTFVRYFSNVPMPLRGRHSQIRLRDATSPLHVRLGTSDASVLEEIYVRHVYACITGAGLKGVHQVMDLGANIGLSARL